METKVFFISTDSFYSKKQEQDFYIVYLVMNNKPVSYYVTREVFDKINLKKLKQFIECIAIFDTKLIGNNFKATLVDIK